MKDVQVKIENRVDLNQRTERDQEIEKIKILVDLLKEREIILVADPKIERKVNQINPEVDLKTEREDLQDLRIKVRDLEVDQNRNQENIEMDQKVIPRIDQKRLKDKLIQ